MTRLASISFISWLCVAWPIAAADENKAVADKPLVVELWPGKGLRGAPAVSHISQKTSEMWGTRLFLRG